MAAIAASVPQKKPSLYFVNPWIDYSLIGGASILGFLGLWAFHDGQSMDKIYAMTAFLTLIVNHPHFAATNYRMYHSKTNILQFPVTALVVPIVILAGVIASVAYPQVVAPYFVKLFILWSPYHFSGQSVGVTMIYARRAGFKVGVWERRALSGFIFSCFVTTLLTFDTRPEGYEYFGMTYPGLGLPEWMVTVSTIFMYTCAVGVIALAIRWCRAEKRILPPIVLLPALTHYVWFLGGTKLPAFQEFVPFFHSLQYMVVAWTVQLGETLHAKPAETIETSRGTSLSFLASAIRWWIISIGIGHAIHSQVPSIFPASLVTNYALAALFALAVAWLLQQEPQPEPSRRFVWVNSVTWWLACVGLGAWMFDLSPYLFPTSGVTFYFVTGIVAAGVQMHHFFVDGVIWKLKNKTNVSPVMSNLADFVGPRPVLTPALQAGATVV